MQYFFETYGCQMNSAESAALALVCKERGWQEAANADTADLVLLNTCSVRATAETRVFGRIAHYTSIKKKSKRRIVLVIAGCMASRLGDKLKTQYPAIDYVMGTHARSTFPLILEAAENGEHASIDINETPAFSFSNSHLEEGQFRSFVPIMHGCNNFCSYCIVPYVRGREVSRDPQHIIEEIRLVGERGVREVTLLGQNVNSYLFDWGLGARDWGSLAWRQPLGTGDWGLGRREQGIGNREQVDFAGLLRFIAREIKDSGVQWVRFLSANPRNFSSEVIRVMAEFPVFCRHVHLPVQHGSNSILQAMNRGYTRERFLELAAEIRAAMPEVTLSTDILIGFPGETEDDVRQTIDLMKEIKFLYSFMYHFNPREGTKAFDLPGRIDEEVKKERLARIIDLQLKQTNTLLKERIGSTETVLIEGISKKNADELITRTEKDEMAVAAGPKSLIGSFAKIKLTAVAGNTLKGELI